MTRPLPKFVEELLSTAPRAGEGVHNWLFRVARQLHAHLPAGEIVCLLENRVTGCGRTVSINEIRSAVQNSFGCAWQPSKNSSKLKIPAKFKWPSVNVEQREAIVKSGQGLVDLWEASPVRIEDNEQHTHEIIQRLFPENSLLCCGKSNHEFDTRLLSDWRNELTMLSLIVPSPMVAIEGKTKEGKVSRHTLSNTGPRRFLICEFDTGTADEHAALLLHLGTFAPLVCVVHSGGKSLHGWFFVAGQPDEKVEKFFRYAVSLGADRSTWTRSQFVRMPDGVRDNGNRQTVYFLSYKPLEVNP